MDKVIPGGRHQQQTCNAEAALIIDQAVCSFYHSSFIHQPLQAEGFHLPLQRPGGQLHDNLTCSAAHFQQVEVQRFQIHCIAEFLHCLRRHGVSGIPNGNPQALEPAILQQMLQLTSHKHIHGDIFGASDMPEQPGNGMLVFGWDTASGCLAQAPPSLVFKELQSGRCKRR
jgi:hypothetical protein